MCRARTTAQRGRKRNFVLTVRTGPWLIYRENYELRACYRKLRIIAVQLGRALRTIPVARPNQAQALVGLA